MSEKNSEVDEKEKKPYGLSFFQKAALSPFLAAMKKADVKNILIELDDKFENGMDFKFYLNDVKVMTIDEFNELKKMIEL